MKAIRQKVHGSILEGEAGDLLLDESADPLYLRYAFVTLGPEEHILPAFLLDDWGKEIKGLGLYEWVEENGLYFPRAEMFGFSPSGQETQVFLRALDLVLKYRVYAYPQADTPLAEGWFIENVYLPDASVTKPEPAKRPSAAPRLLAKSAVRWFKIPK